MGKSITRLRSTRRCSHAVDRVSCIRNVNVHTIGMCGETISWCIQSINLAAFVFKLSDSGFLFTQPKCHNAAVEMSTAPEWSLLSKVRDSKSKIK